MTIYKPTWLYIKKHNTTGLKYFGKTTNLDPVKYPGSGKYWKNHIKKHGNDVYTLWCFLYTDELVLMEEAIAFSVTHDIVNSPEWANLKIETGRDGGAICGRKLRESTKKKIGDANRGRKMSPEFSKMRSIIQSTKTPWNKGKTGGIGHNLGKKFGTPSDEYRKKMSELMTGRPKEKIICPHCQKEGGKPSMIRFHFDNCKQRPDTKLL